MGDATQSSLVFILRLIPCRGALHVLYACLCGHGRNTEALSSHEGIFGSSDYIPRQWSDVIDDHSASRLYVDDHCGSRRTHGPGCVLLRKLV